jgi:hypothetical protein
VEQLRIDRTDDFVLPVDMAGDDVRFSEQLVEHFLGRFTQPGDLVLDPFAGFGTTAVVAERLGCRSISVELLSERTALIRSRVGPTAEVVTGDARQLATMPIPPVDLVITSPPYMTANDHPQNPLTGYLELGGDYSGYLDDMLVVFDQVRAVLKPGCHAVVNVANLSHQGMVTHLALDIRRVLSTILDLEAEVRILDDNHPPTSRRSTASCSATRIANSRASGDGGGLGYGPGVPRCRSARSPSSSASEVMVWSEGCRSFGYLAPARLSQMAVSPALPSIGSSGEGAARPDNISPGCGRMALTSTRIGFAACPWTPCLPCR